MRQILDVIKGLEKLQSISYLSDDTPIITRNDTIYTLKDVINILKNSDDDELYECILDGLKELEKINRENGKTNGKKYKKRRE